MVSGRAGHARRRHPRLGRGLVAHGADDDRRRPDEDEAGGDAGFGEIGALGEEAVARMDSLGAGRLGRADEVRDREIGLRRRRRADAHGGVGEAHMQGLGVGVAVDGNDAEALGAGGADDPAGDLAAIGDKDGREARGQGFSAHDGARFSLKAARPSRASGPRRASAKFLAAISM